jgi:TPP-dependent pyruvate/acetoin dehydrogenase alpha subunit
VFVCENNLYGASTSFHQVSLVADVAERARAYGVPSQIVDGMDVLAVRDAVAGAVAHARADGGPTLIECKTYRFTGHSRSDARGYRTREEEEGWAQRDPLIVNGARLDEELREELEAEVRAELDEAVEFARDSPSPDPAQALEDIYA